MQQPRTSKRQEQYQLITEVPRLQWASIPRHELNIEACLHSGQVFLWDNVGRNQYVVATHDTLLFLEAHDHGFGWATWPIGRWGAVEALFRLNVCLSDLYDLWVRSYPPFLECLRGLEGLRVLRVDPGVALLTFVCSSCNNVPRIQRMVHRLAESVGRQAYCPWAPGWHFHPSVEDLSLVSEQTLRQLGFGYRAQFLAPMAGSWPAILRSLKECDRSVARSLLMGLPGVGPKVADCVLLFGLGLDSSVPVDTHVRRYIVRHFAPDYAGRSLTAATYDALARRFRGIMGPYAGWAQQYAFMQERRRRAMPQHHEEHRNVELV